MPVNFQFKDIETKEPASIAEIDDKIADFEEVTPHETQAYLFDKYGWLGIAILMRSGGSVITPGALSNFLAHSEQDFTQRERDCMEKFFILDYEFHAWR